MILSESLVSPRSILAIRLWDIFQKRRAKL